MECGIKRITSVFSAKWGAMSSAESNDGGGDAGGLKT